MKVRARYSGGFTLIEAMVALVILSTALTGLFGLINTDLISLRRAEAVVASQNALQEATRQIRLQTLSNKARGQLQLPGYDAEWTAQLVEPITYGRGPRGGVGAYDHGLYDIDVSLSSQGRSLGTWTVRVAQYQRVRKLEIQ